MSPRAVFQAHRPLAFFWSMAGLALAFGMTAWAAPFLWTRGEAVSAAILVAVMPFLLLGTAQQLRDWAFGRQVIVTAHDIAGAEIAHLQWDELASARLYTLQGTRFFGFTLTPTSATAQRLRIWQRCGGWLNRLLGYPPYFIRLSGFTAPVEDVEAVFVAHCRQRGVPLTGAEALDATRMKPRRRECSNCGRPAPANVVRCGDCGARI